MGADPAATVAAAVEGKEQKKSCSWFDVVYGICLPFLFWGCADAGSLLTWVRRGAAPRRP